MKNDIFYGQLTEKYIDPFTDFGFKKLFGEECNKELLLDFLNELLQKEEGKIISLTYLKTEQLGISKDSRKAIFDLYCENERGEKFIVQLKKTKQEYFKDRALYYSTFSITGQAKQGDWNYELKEVYVVAILDFIFEEDRNDKDKYRYDIMLSDIETHKIFYNKLKFVYLEMPKFNKKVEELKTHFEKWMYVLKNLNKLDDIPEELREAIYEKLFFVAAIANLTPEEYNAYNDSLKLNRDLKNSLDYAEKKGKEEGIAEGMEKGEAIGIEKGMEKGMEKGKLEDKIEIALNMLKDKMPIEVVSKYTGLSIDQIIQLKKQI
jgi:predicted transposase/invertase (TIGR01784 family)